MSINPVIVIVDDFSNTSLNLLDGAYPVIFDNAYIDQYIIEGYNPGNVLASEGNLYQYKSTYVNLSLIDADGDGFTFDQDDNVWTSIPDTNAWAAYDIYSKKEFTDNSVNHGENVLDSAIKQLDNPSDLKVILFDWDVGTDLDVLFSENELNPVAGETVFEQLINITLETLNNNYSDEFHLVGTNFSFTDSQPDRYSSILDDVPYNFLVTANANVNNPPLISWSWAEDRYVSVGAYNRDYSGRSVIADYSTIDDIDIIADGINTLFGSTGFGTSYATPRILAEIVNYYESEVYPLVENGQYSSIGNAIDALILSSGETYNHVEDFVIDAISTDIEILFAGEDDYKPFKLLTDDYETYGLQPSAIGAVGDVLISDVRLDVSTPQLTISELKYNFINGEDYFQVSGNYSGVDTDFENIENIKITFSNKLSSSFTIDILNPMINSDGSFSVNIEPIFISGDLELPLTSYSVENVSVTEISGNTYEWPNDFGSNLNSLMLSSDNQDPEYNISSVEFSTGDESFWLIKGKYIDQSPPYLIRTFVEHNDDVNGVGRYSGAVGRKDLNQHGEFEIKIPVPDSHKNSSSIRIDGFEVLDAYGNVNTANTSELNSINSLTETYLDGGVGGDIYYGGIGKDTFVLTDFSVYAELGIAYEHDRILGFEVGEDKIKLPTTVQFKDLIFTQSVGGDDIIVKIVGSDGQDIVLAKVAPTQDTTLSTLANKNNFIVGFEANDLRIETINDTETIIVSGKVAEDVVGIELEFEIKPTGAPAIALGDANINDEGGISAKPLSINGYYPLYTSEEMANAASEGNGSAHSHTFTHTDNGQSVTYYMPDGLTEFSHGDHNGNYVDDYGAPDYFILQLTLPSDLPNGNITISGGYFRLSGEADTNFGALDMSETYNSPIATELNDPELTNLSVDIVAGPNGIPVVKLSGQYTDESSAKSLRLFLNLEKTNISVADDGVSSKTNDIVNGFEFIIEGDLIASIMDDTGSFEYMYNMEDILSVYFNQNGNDTSLFGRLNFHKIIATDTSDNIKEVSDLDITEPLFVNPGDNLPSDISGSNVVFTSPTASSIIVSGNDIWDLINLHKNFIYDNTGIFKKYFETPETLNIEDTAFGSSGNDFLNTGSLGNNKVFSGSGDDFISGSSSGYFYGNSGNDTLTIKKVFPVLSPDFFTDPTSDGSSGNYSEILSINTTRTSIGGVEAPLINVSFTSKLTDFTNISFSVDGQLVSVDFSNAQNITNEYKMLFNNSGLPTGGLINYSPNHFMIWVSDLGQFSNVEGGPFEDGYDENVPIFLHSITGSNSNGDNNDADDTGAEDLDIVKDYSNSSLPGSYFREKVFNDTNSSAKEYLVNNVVEYISHNPMIIDNFNNTVFDGGSGTDEIIIPGKLEDYSVETNNDVTTVTKNSNGEVITIESVEKISFRLGNNTETVSLNPYADYDQIVGGSGDQTIFGSSGSDFVTSGGGNDQIFTGSGKDAIYLTGIGDPLVDAGGGDDVIRITADFSGNLTLRGGGGIDILEIFADYSVNVDGTSVILETGQGTITLENQLVDVDGELVFNADNGISLIRRLEVGDDGKETKVRDVALNPGEQADYALIMLTSEINDFEIADEDLNVNKYAISGLAGDDYIRAGNLDDTIDGGDGSDLLLGLAGRDIILGGESVDILIGGEGDDTLHGDEGSDYYFFDFNLYGGATSGSGESSITESTELSSPNVFLNSTSSNSGLDTIIDTSGDMDTLFLVSGTVSGLPNSEANGGSAASPASSSVSSNIFDNLDVYIKDGNLHIIDEFSGATGSNGAASGESGSNLVDQSIDRSLINSGLIIEGFTSSEDTIERLVIANDNNSLSLIQDKFFELENNFNTSQNVEEESSSQSASIFPEDWDLYPTYGYWYSARSENLKVEIEGSVVSLVYDDGGSSYALWTGDASQVDKFVFPSSGLEIEVSRIIYPEDWDLYPTYGYWYSARSENLKVEIEGSVVSLVYDDGGSSYALWTGDASQVDKFVFPSSGLEIVVPKEQAVDEPINDDQNSMDLALEWGVSEGLAREFYLDPDGIVDPSDQLNYYLVADLDNVGINVAGSRAEINTDGTQKIVFDEDLVGKKFADYSNADAFANGYLLLTGGEGDDILYGTDSNPVYNEDGTPLIIPLLQPDGTVLDTTAPVIDIMDAGGGDDILYGKSGPNLLVGGYGDDTFIIEGGEGKFSTTTIFGDQRLYLSDPETGENIPYGTLNESFSDKVYIDWAYNVDEISRLQDGAINISHMYHNVTLYDVEAAYFKNPDGGYTEVVLSRGKVVTSEDWFDLSSEAESLRTEGFGFNIDGDEISLTYNDTTSSEYILWSGDRKTVQGFDLPDGRYINIINVEDYDSVTGDALDINTMTTDGTDIVFGNESDNVIDGKGGDDILLGGGGDDVLIGNLGDDIIIGGDGEDIIRGDVPVDDLAGSYFAAGYFDDDALIDLGGRDVMIGGDGIDDIATGEGNDAVASGRLETTEGSDAADIDLINNAIDSDKDLFEDDEWI